MAESRAATPVSFGDNISSSQSPATDAPYFDVIAADFYRDHDPFRYLSARTAAVDASVLRTVSSVFGPNQLQQIVVAAVGGYGRSELFPFSDLDLLFVLKSESELDGIKEPLAECVRLLWDAGLRLGHSVRTISECTRLREDNTELHISLLDIRYLGGNSALFDLLDSDLARFFGEYSLRFRELLAGLARSRHRKWNDTVFHLEPNIKETPGGLRDLHLLFWLHKLAPRVQVVQDSLSELAGARRFLYALRCFLHLQTQRDNNLLSFELQDRVAEALATPPMPPEDCMRLYYKQARAIYEPALGAIRSVPGSRSTLLRQMKEVRSRWAKTEWSVRRDQVVLPDNADTFLSIDGLFRLFIFVASSGLQLSWETQRAVRSAVASFALTSAAASSTWDRWKELLSTPWAAVALREMQVSGLLTFLLPEWNRVESLVVRDFYHRYTVDEHTFVAIETIDELSRHNGNNVRIEQLLAQTDDAAVLKLAILLHDIGKGTDPGHHVRGSLEVASAVLSRIEAPRQILDEVRFLIDRHLELSLVMNGRDLEDPATARYLTQAVNTAERLRLLTLFTFADISAVNPTAMTPWRFEQLWRVYQLGAEQFSHDLVSDRIHLHASESDTNFPEEMDSFLEGLPTRYLRTHTEAEIKQHFALQGQALESDVAVSVERESGAYVLTVLASDRSGLFSDVCGALASFGMNIVKAEAFANAAGLVVDVFRFVDPMRTLELNPGEMESLRWTVAGALLGQLDVRELLRRRRRPRVLSSGAKIQGSIRFNNEASERATLIAFIGEDRPGLLYDLTSALSARGCDIAVVMIDTEGHKAIDVFYVTQDGAKLTASTMTELQGDLLRAAADPAA